MATIMGPNGLAGGPAGWQALYGGERIPCGIGCGGTADVVRVTTAEHGGGEVWLECVSCAQRVRLEVPAAEPAERRAVADALEAGHEATCPRHGPRMTLVRRGRRLVCPGCGVLFRE